VTKPKRTAAQQKSFEASKKNGTSKMTKSQSMNKFKNDKAMQKKYTSNYASKPATRPSHIPATTSVGGRNVNVTYNVNHGGYGYTNSLGAYIMYDMMADSMMRNRMMTNNNYLYAGHPSVVGTHAPVIVHQRNSGFVLLMTMFGVIVVVVVGGVILKGLGVI
jgi:hypothetical protein